jgi:hypothetical protein
MRNARRPHACFRDQSARLSTTTESQGRDDKSLSIQGERDGRSNSFPRGRKQTQSAGVFVGIVWLVLYAGIILAGLWSNSESWLTAMNRSELF